MAHPAVKAWLGKLRQPKDWFNQRVRIFFIDPVTLALAQTNPDGDGNGQGFELVFPKAWVAKAMPYVKLGLTVLKVAAVAGKLGGIPIPDVKAVAGEWLDKQLAVLDELKGEALQQIGTMKADKQLAAELLGKVDAQCAKMLNEKLGEAHVREDEALGEQLRAPLEKSLKELDELLKKDYPGWKETCGLVLTTSDPRVGGDGTS